MTRFFLFFYRVELKDLLLSELSIKHPKLSLSFSNKEFISMKGNDQNVNELKNDPIVFAKRQAVFIDKSNAPTENQNVKVGESFWNYKVIPNFVDLLGFKNQDIPSGAPARAYQKMEQAHRLFELNIDTEDTIVEVGSAPGGISFYLLELGIRLVSIDPAEMDQKLKQNYGAKFTHIKKSIFDVDRNEFPKNCDWIVSDLNLPGDINLNQVKRIMEYYPHIKGAFLTVKVPNTSELEKISKWVKSFKNFNAIPVHLPAHRRELGIIVKRK